MNHYNKIIVKSINASPTIVMSPLHRRSYCVTSDLERLGELAYEIQQITTEFPHAKLKASFITKVGADIVQLARDGVRVRHPSPGACNSFWIEIEAVTRWGSSENFVLQGYTNFEGITPNGVVSDDVVFVVNSIIRVAEVASLGPGLARPYVVDSASIIHPAAESPGEKQVPEYGIRPGDIFVGVQSERLIDVLSGRDGGEFFDARLALQPQSSRSQRSNSNPSEYLASILSAYTSASAVTEFGFDTGDVMSSALQNCYDGPLHASGVFQQLLTTEGRLEFTIADLERIDPNVRCVVKHTPGPEVPPAVYSSWAEGDQSTLAAALLAVTVPGLMSKYGLSSIIMTASNADSESPIITNDQMVVEYTDSRHIPELDTDNALRLFLADLELSVLPRLSMNGMRFYSVAIIADFFGNTIFIVNLDGVEKHYILPTYMDSVIAPVVVSTKEAHTEIIDKFSCLFYSF